MLSLIDKIRTGYLWDFPGGIHPPENKVQSTQTPLVEARLAHEYVLPLKQHIGKSGDLLVQVGDNVLKGQPLTSFSTTFMLPVHAPTSGVVSAIEPRTVAHPSGLSELCVVITPDGKDQWCDRHPVVDYTQTQPEELIDIIRNAGIAGLGGAGFPTAKKIQSGLSRVEIFIVNAAECEPYITADDALMREHAQEIIDGIGIVEHILQPKLTVIGVEDNKPEAIRALQLAAEGKDIVIRAIPTKYPSGGAKQLIKLLTDLEVPAGKHSADIGVIVQNVGSIQAIKRAVVDGEPLIRRVVTLTGKTFTQPRNVWVRLGTPVQSLLDEFGYQADKKLPRLILGGSMMGFTLPHANVPIVKIANCILAPSRNEIPQHDYEMACIRCGQCADACPASLLPQQLYWHSKAEEYDKCEELNLKDCIECGACAYVCPSEIPLVQYYRQSKAEIKNRQWEAEAAERAKLRFEEKKARMEREKAERENRFKKAADDRRKEMQQSGGEDAIAAAIARVKAQKAQSETSDAPVKPAVAAAIAKAKAKQAEAAKAGATEPDNSDMAKLREERKRQARERKAEKADTGDVASSGDEKKAAVAAAIARAKARKAAQPESNETPVTQAPATHEPADDPKKAAVTAAIARAKARKAAQPESSETSVTQDPATDEPTGDPKKAAVAAAIARAKARKAAQPEASDKPVVDNAPAEAPAVEEPTGDPKKAAVAAAIARAKARKAAQQETSERPAVDNAPVEAPAAEEPTGDPKKAAVSAAIARAKARKAAQQETSERPAVDNAPVEAPAAEEPSGDPNKAAVAAAIARAKARKAAQQEANDKPEVDHAPVEAPAVEEPTGDPKKAAVAAAIARAKARKAAQQAENQTPNNVEEND
ncbi:electron transport complex subunit RsxC [Vibrio furnissii]|uniref:electron transport complex subunit RsxC n=1 Tax=Vibrio furnissii TaxID=29494 RepID=UPI001EEA71FD|nr:electron transport complex subunit RsxC [Vibrio furnissii]MCG6266458.1 electron transport complex subunit RsxC [Vibrio furnissii]